MTRGFGFRTDTVWLVIADHAGGSRTVWTFRRKKYARELYDRIFYRNPLVVLERHEILDEESPAGWQPSGKLLAASNVSPDPRVPS